MHTDIEGLSFASHLYQPKLEFGDWPKQAGDIDLPVDTIAYAVEDSLLNRYRRTQTFAKKCALIVVDEVRKRTQPPKCLLPFVMKHRDLIPVALMSATIDPKESQKYGIE